MSKQLGVLRAVLSALSLVAQPLRQLVRFSREQVARGRERREARREARRDRRGR